MQLLRHSEFVIGIPEGWLDNTLVVLRSPDTADELAATITISRHKVDTNVSVAQFAKQQIPAIQEAFAEYNLRVVEEREARIAGLDAFQLRLEFWADDHHPRITQLQSYVIYRDTVYVIAATDNADRFPEHQQVFREMISCFGFQD